MADTSAPPSPDRTRSGPKRWDVRMTISIPALLVLLVLGMGLASYLMVDRAAAELTARAPDYDPAPMYRRVLIVSGLFLGLALTAGAALVWNVLRPIRQMASAVEDIARGHTYRHVRIKGGFEIDQLGRSFNAMINFLNDMIDQRDTYMSEAFVAGSMTADLEGRISSINATGLSILGAERADLIGKSFDEVRRERPDLAPSLVEFCHDTLDKDGSIMPVEISLGGTNDDKPLTVAYSFLRDAAGVPTSVIFHFRDASRMDDLSEMFLRSDHLAALGTFTIGLSHELRNPLGAIKGTAQLLEELVGERQDCAPYVARIVHEVDRLDQLVRELYDFSRSPGGRQAACDLNQVVGDALHQVQLGLDDADKADRTVREDYADALPPVIVQRERVRRAVANVIINAFEHTPAGGTVELRTGPLTGDASSPVFLDVTNSGSTIPQEDRERVFEPFYSTTPGGTGLGLSIAYQIVAQNHGALDLTDNAGPVRFRFTFRSVQPVAPAVAAGAHDAS